MTNWFSRLGLWVSLVGEGLLCPFRRVGSPSRCLCILLWVLSFLAYLHLLLVSGEC